MASPRHLQTSVPIKPSTIEDCLEALHALGATRGVVPVAAVAQWLGMTASLVVVVLDQIVDRGLAEGSVITGLRLTSAGRRETRRVVRRRRVLESLLMAEHEYSLEKAQIVVARVAYALSDEIVERVVALFGEPDLTPRPEPAPAWAVAMREHTAATTGEDGVRLAPRTGSAAPSFQQPSSAHAWPFGPPADGKWDA